MSCENLVAKLHWLQSQVLEPVFIVDHQFSWFDLPRRGDLLLGGGLRREGRLANAPAQGRQRLRGLVLHAGRRPDGK